MYVSKQTLNDGMVDAASSMMSSETRVDSSDTLVSVGESVPSPYKMSIGHDKCPRKDWRHYGKNVPLPKLHPLW